MPSEVPPDVDWLDHPDGPCPACGAGATRKTYVHMEWIHCAACGFDQTALFHPAIDPELLNVEPIHAFIDFAGIEPNARNLHALSKLNAELGRLRPAELKSLLVSGKRFALGPLYPDALERLRASAAGTAFTIIEAGGD